MKKVFLFPWSWILNKHTDDEYIHTDFIVIMKDNITRELWKILRNDNHIV